MSNNIYGDTELARENLWARKQDAKALDALRRKMDAESEMSENLANLHKPDA
jgi:hypothetical protein